MVKQTGRSVRQLQETESRQILLRSSPPHIKKQTKTKRYNTLADTRLKKKRDNISKKKTQVNKLPRRTGPVISLDTPQTPASFPYWS